MRTKSYAAMNNSEINNPFIAIADGIADLLRPECKFIIDVCHIKLFWPSDKVREIEGVITITHTAELAPRPTNYYLEIRCGRAGFAFTNNDGQSYKFGYENPRDVENLIRKVENSYKSWARY